MATKKPTHKLVLRCEQSDSGTYETTLHAGPASKQASFRCPACDLKIILLLPQLEFRAHGKSAETLQHKLLMLQEL
jgi:hypothetical protein